MKNLEFIDEHNCKIMETLDTIAINQRHFQGQKRWFWERELKGKSTADEIKYCPYCGELLKTE